MQVIESILADAAQIAAMRRDIHAHPELCFEEKRTSDLIAEQLTGVGHPDPPRPRHDRHRRRS